MAESFNELRPRYPKDGQETREEQSWGSKQLKDELLRIGQASNIGPAPPMRVYSRDYSKKDPDGDQQDDTLSPYLGNPLAL
jgi:hypothetical protein